MGVAELPLDEIVRRARGEAPADLLLRGGRVVNVFSGELLESDVAIAGGTVVGLGRGYEARETIDLAGQVVAPDQQQFSGPENRREGASKVVTQSRPSPQRRTSSCGCQQSGACVPCHRAEPL